MRVNIVLRKQGLLSYKLRERTSHQSALWFDKYVNLEAAPSYVRPWSDGLLDRLSAAIIAF